MQIRIDPFLLFLREDIMEYIILIAVLLLVGYAGSKADKFKLSSSVRIIEEDDGWVVYSRTWDSIIYFVNKWNDNLDMYGEVTLYDFPGVYWSRPVYKTDISRYPSHNNEYMYMLHLPEVSDDWGYRRGLQENENQ